MEPMAYQRMSEVEEQRLIKLAQGGNKLAMEELIKANSGLVVKIARSEFWWRLDELKDLIQEGLLGLVIAIKRFDATKSSRLCHYAGFWIRAQISGYILNTTGGNVRIDKSRAARKVFFNLGKAKRKLSMEYYEPSQDDQKRLAELIGVSSDQLTRAMARMSSKHDLRLDGYTRDGTAIIDSLVDSGQTPEESVAEIEILTQQYMKLKIGLEALTDKERTVIEQRYLGRNPKTLAEVGYGFGISRERVRQIEERALRKIRVVIHGDLT